MQRVLYGRQTSIGDIQSDWNTHPQAKGRCLPNVRCTETEGGLLGKTLLTLVANKGNPNGDLPLPDHKFSTHDIVALRPSSGGAESPVIVQGVIYRVTDASLVVAVDELPDDDAPLDAPLRIDKLANTVRPRSACSG